MYDPGLDWQGQSEAQGFGFTTADKQLSDAQRQEGLTGFTGGFDGQNFTTQGALGALAQRLDRGQQDYQTATGNLQRSYGQLAGRQGGTARMMGVAHGGTEAASGQARASNEATQQGALDTNWRRFQEDVGNARSSALYGALTGQEGSDLNYSHAENAHTLFGEQTDQAKIQSARQLGNLPSTPPPGQVIDPNSPVGKALGVPTTAGEVPAFKSMGIPDGTPVFTSAKGTFFQQPAAGGGVWHIYSDGSRVKTR